MIIEISDPENASLRVEGEIKVWRLKGEERFEGGRGRRDFKGEGEGGSRKKKKGRGVEKKNGKNEFMSGLKLLVWDLKIW